MNHHNRESAATSETHEDTKDSRTFTPEGGKKHETEPGGPTEAKIVHTSREEEEKNGVTPTSGSHYTNRL